MGRHTKGKKTAPSTKSVKSAEEQIDREIVLLERSKKCLEAKDDLIKFAELMMPDPEFPLDSSKSKYHAERPHRLLADALMDVEAGRCNRLIVSLPPRVGKSQLSSRYFPAWFVGRDPHRHTILIGYNEKMGEGFGKNVRNFMQSHIYKEIFPDTRLERGSAASGFMVTEESGEMIFTGRGGTITGRGGDIVIVDDLFKNRKEANSETMRNDIWDFFTGDAMSRMMTESAAIIIVMTRRHEDDIVGRIIDPANEYFNEEEFKSWRVVNVPGLCTDPDNDPLDRKMGESVWPDRFSTKYYNDWLRRDSKEFHAVVQQDPSPADGNEITKESIVKYRPNELPKNLKIYAASDHAFGTGKGHDYSCYLVVGVCENDIIWVIDCWWKKKPTDICVEKMIDLMHRHRPLLWWAARDHIQGSIAPFLKTRMKERGVYCKIKQSSEQLGTGSGKLQKAQAIIGRMAMGMVKFPADAIWMGRAESEMLKFPGGAHDDFVDALAHLGRGLTKFIKPPKDTNEATAAENTVGTFAWTVATHKREQAVLKQKSRGGW